MNTHSWRNMAWLHISIAQCLTNENFLSALFENWERGYKWRLTSFLTAYLFQKGTAKSRDPEEPAAEKHDL